MVSSETSNIFSKRKYQRLFVISHYLHLPSLHTIPYNLHKIHRESALLKVIQLPLSLEARFNCCSLQLLQNIVYAF